MSAPPTLDEHCAGEHGMVSLLFERVAKMLAQE